MGVQESQGGRNKNWKLQDCGLTEAEGGWGCCHRVSEGGETRGLGPRLQRGGRGRQSLHSLGWGLDWRGPRAWKPVRERSRAITRLSGEWRRPLPTPYKQQVSHFLTLSSHPQEEETAGPLRSAGKGPKDECGVLNLLSILRPLL